MSSPIASVLSNPNIGYSLPFLFSGIAIYLNHRINRYRKCKHKFVKVGIPKNIRDVKVSPSLENNIKRFKAKNFSEEYLSYIKEFVQTIKNNFDERDTITLRNNLNTLLIHNKDDKETMKKIPKSLINGACAFYAGKPNKIFLFENNFNPIILFHELFHMSSTRYINGIYYSGFSQAYGNDLTIVGEGLNEGYTQLLTKRYFSRFGPTHGYNYLVFYAELIERLVGREKMQSLYMNSDLRSLIGELNKYSSLEDIMRFISDLDIIFKYVYDDKIEFPFQVTETNKAMKRINLYIIHAYIEYIKQDSINIIRIDRNCENDIREFERVIAIIKSSLIKKAFNRQDYHFSCHMSDEKTKKEIKNHIYEAWKSIEEARNNNLHR